MVYVFLCTDEKVTLDFSRALQQARIGKGLTQKELATVRGPNQYKITRTVKLS